MRRVLLFVGLGALCASFMSLSVGVAAAAHHKKKKKSHNYICKGTLRHNVKHDVIVPKGKKCVIDAVKIGHNVIVKKNATLVDHAASIGHDIRATKPRGIRIFGRGRGHPGHVGHNIWIKGVWRSQRGKRTNLICNQRVGHDVIVKKSTRRAGQWIIGDHDEGCTGSGSLFGHDLIVKENKNRVDVSDNGLGTPPYAVGIGHDLIIKNNRVFGLPRPSPIADSNVVGLDALCQPGTTTDGDFTPNIAGRTNTCPR